MKIRGLLLPIEYQQVEYIESSGTQYINTNYIPKVNNVNLELDMAWAGNTLGAFETFMGFMKSTTENNPRIGLHKYSSRLMFGANAITTSEIAPVKNERFIYRGDFTSGAQKLYKNGTQITTNGTTYDFSTNTCPVYIFARYCPNSMNYSTMRVYRAKIYEGTTLKMDFIPCYRKSDSVIGLYELVNETFYTNAGSGTFIKGNNVFLSYKTPIALEGTTNLISGIASVNSRCSKSGNGVFVNWSSSAGDTYFFFSMRSQPAANTTYTLSFKVSGLNGETGIVWAWSNLNDNQYKVEIKNGLNAITFTLDGTETRCFFDDKANKTGVSYYMYDFQLEAKDHATLYVNGTREDNTIVNFKPHTTLLPPEYQQTEYTANTDGAQYIEYPFIPDYNKGWKFEIGFNPTDTTTRYALTANYNVGSYQVSLELRANAKARLWCNSGGKDMDSSNSFVANQLNNATFSYYSGVCTIVLNGVTTTSSGTVSGICSSTSMYMFLDKAKRTSTFPKSIKIYYLRVYDGTDLVFNLIPCYRKSDNVIGMYDIVNKVFYSNSGTGNFTKGNNKVTIL